MSRHLSRSFVLAAVIALAAAPSTAQDKQKEPPKPGGGASPSTVTDLLAKRVSVDAVRDTRFADVIKRLSDDYELPLVLDPSLARGEGPAACDGAEERPVKLPRLVNVRLDTVLRLLCDQADATYLVYPEYIKIVHATYALYETGVLPAEPANPDAEPPLLPPTELQKARPLIKRAVVTAAFRKVPLRQVLDDIAEATGATLVLSPDAGPAADTAVTVRFANTPVDAAVRTLCELTDLGVIEDANVLLVTTRDRAAHRAAVDAEKRKAKLVEAGGGGVPGGFGPGGFGPGGFGPGPGLDVANELSRLREQNEQLKAHIEELRKQIRK